MRLMFTIKWKPGVGFLQQRAFYESLRAARIGIVQYATDGRRFYVYEVTRPTRGVIL